MELFKVAVGEGIGWGLAVTHSLVVKHGGAITVESPPGAGSTCTIYLPWFDELVNVDTPLVALLPGGKERSLFVDDEEVLARLGQELLRPLGYEVTICTSRVEALETCRATPDRYDLVIADQTMPHLTGDRLAVELRRLRPDIPIIVCSGFRYMVNDEKIQALRIDAFCMKLVMRHDLAHTIKRVFTQRAAQAITV